MPNLKIFCDFKIPCKIIDIEVGIASLAYKENNDDAIHIPAKIKFETTAGIAAQIGNALGCPMVITEQGAKGFDFDDLLYNIPKPDDGLDGNPRADSFEDVSDSVFRVCEAAPRQFANSILFKYFHDYYLTGLNPENRKIIEDILADLAGITRKLNEEASATQTSSEDEEPVIVSKAKTHQMQRYPKPPTIDDLEQSGYAYAILASYMAPLRSMLSFKSKFEYDKISRKYTQRYDEISKSMSPLLDAAGKTYCVTVDTTWQHIQALRQLYIDSDAGIIDNMAFPKNAAKFIFAEAVNQYLEEINSCEDTINKQK